MIDRPISRRRALRNISAGSLAVAPFLQGFAARAQDKTDTLPKRFVFIVRSNGILPTEIQPKTLPGLVVPRGAPLRQKKFRGESLAKHELPGGLKSLEPFKDRLSIFQGLSGRMANSDHGSGYGALGAYKSGKGGAAPTFATVDGALTEGSKSPFPHIGFAMEVSGPQVVYPGLFAAAPGKPLPCYADPLLAYGDLFGSVISDEKLKAAVQVDKNVLDFMAGDVARFQKNLPQAEKEKLDHYLDGFEALRIRSKRLAAMEDVLKSAAPGLTESFGSEIETERLDAHFELATAALVGGLTQVVSIRADHLGMRLTGLGLGTKTVHHIGHMIEGKQGGGGGQDFANGMGEFATRELIMDYHMRNVAKMAAKLKSVPEGDGTMLDNTVIVYLSDHGEKHHSNCYEWPMVALGNIRGAFKAGHYIHVPGWGEPGHRTIAHLYKSFLHAAGLPTDNFGQPDRTLPESIDQTGFLEEWMA